MKKTLLLLLTAALCLRPAVAEQLLALTTTGNLVSFDTATPGKVSPPIPTTGLQTGETIAGIDFRPRTGQLYLLGVTPNGATDTIRIYTLDPSTGVATQLPGSVTFTVGQSDGYGFDFNPTVDRIRVVNNADENFRINPNNGIRADNPVNDTDLSPAGAAIEAVAYDRNLDTGLAVANRTTLFGIARSTSSLVTIGGYNQSPGPNLGAVSNSKPLGVTIASGSAVAFDISATTGSSHGWGAWEVNPSSLTHLYSVNLTSGSATDLGLIGDGTLSIVGLTSPPLTRIAIGPEGKKNQVQVRDPAAPAYAQTFTNSETLLKGGVRVAVGDVTSDGIPDLITGAGKGVSGHVKVFDGQTGAEVLDLIPFEPTFLGGIYVATGDVNGDGRKDIVVSSGPGRDTEVKVFDGLSNTFLFGEAPFPGTDNGCTVAVADIDVDGDADILVGAGPGLPPEVKLLAADGSTVATFTPFGSRQSTAGVFVAAGHSAAGTDPQAKPVLVSSLGKNSSEVKIGALSVPLGSSSTYTEVGAFNAFPGRSPGGVRVAVGDINQDGVLEILCVPGPGYRHVRYRAFSIVDRSLIRTFNPFASDGGFIGAGR